MNLNRLQSTQQALFNFVNQFKTYLGRAERLHWCWMYLSGLLLDGERKSIQPMAERLPGGNEQAMQQFVNQSPWEHETIQTDLACFLAQQLAIKRGVLVLDDSYAYYISNAPIDTPLQQLVQWAHERYKVEQGYQQLKEELGLDHFEGRSWRGLHHHITLCFMAYAFLLLLKQQQAKKAVA